MFIAAKLSQSGEHKNKLSACLQIQMFHSKVRKSVTVSLSKSCYDNFDLSEETNSNTTKD